MRSCCSIFGDCGECELGQVLSRGQHALPPLSIAVAPPHGEQSRGAAPPTFNRDLPGLKEIPFRLGVGSPPQTDSAVGYQPPAHEAVRPYHNSKERTDALWSWLRYYNCGKSDQAGLDLSRLVRARPSGGNAC